MTLPDNSTVAVIGSGISGIVASYMLSKRYNVSLFEANEKIGGHTNTYTLNDGPDAGTNIDTGFIVFNYKNYPTLTKFFNILGIPNTPTDMSYSFYCYRRNTGFGSRGLSSVFADFRNIYNPDFYKFANEVLRFWRTAPIDLKNGALEGLSVEKYISEKNYSKRFFEDYLSPFSAAIWSSPADQIAIFPIEMLVRFFINHGMISWSEQPQWRTVTGGSQSYLEKFKSIFTGEILTSKPIVSISRVDNKIIVKTKNGEPIEFDGVFIATHADTAYKLLSDPSIEEEKVLKCWSYEKNHTVLHTDKSFLPPLKKLVSAWNYVRPISYNKEDTLTVTYSMNTLQKIVSKESEDKNHYCVTLNPKNSPKNIIYEVDYTHPIYTIDSIKSQKLIPQIQGQRNTWYCGSYCGFGFHEDGAKSAVDACRGLVEF